MKVQIISDIHLEHYPDDFRDFEQIIKSEPGCDILFLAGDIGNIKYETYKPFLDYVSNNWKEIYYVLGNHEFYSGLKINQAKTYEDTLLEYRELILEYWNIYLLTELDDDIFHIWDEDTGMLYFIIGNIGWSFVNFNDDEIKKYINDGKYIYTKDETNKIKTVDNNWFLNKHLDCLKNLRIINKNNTCQNFNKLCDIEDIYADKIVDVKFICLTHFPFSEFEKTSHSKYHSQKKELQDYFCNNFDTYKKYLNYDIYIAGHTHYSYDFRSSLYNNIDTTETIRFISNQKGYPGDLLILNKNFQNTCIFDI
jgi:predicted phosphodiesterase